MKYFTRKRARFESFFGSVNIPYGTVLDSDDTCLLYDGKQICAKISENATKFFCSDDDGQGEERGKLINQIEEILRDSGDKFHQDRWDKIWDADFCQKYKNPNFEDFWLWNLDFYSADISDLKKILGMIVLV